MKSGIFTLSYIHLQFVEEILRDTSSDARYICTVYKATQIKSSQILIFHLDLAPEVFMISEFHVASRQSFSHCLQITEFSRQMNRFREFPVPKWATKKHTTVTQTLVYHILLRLCIFYAEVLCFLRHDRKTVNILYAFTFIYPFNSLVLSLFHLQAPIHVHILCYPQFKNHV